MSTPFLQSGLILTRTLALAAVVATVLPGAVLRAQSNSVPIAIPAANRDSLAFPRRSNSSEAVAARQAQDAFEQTHRQGLRFYNGGADATCEERMGQICYWNNNGDVPPPAERSDARVERAQLVTILERAVAVSPKDDWLIGMLVRYDIEADRPDSALKAARACGATAWWCAALQGLSLHTLNEHAAARSAFDRMLTEMPDSLRCQWTQVGWWLSADSAVQRAYRARPCDERIKSDQKFFRLSQPLWGLPANDLYNEVLARRTITAVHSMGRIPYDMAFGPEIVESQMRYGWPVNWSVQNGGVLDAAAPQVIGHEPTPSYDFTPSATVLANPLTAKLGDWDFNRKKARMRYAPRYASGFGAPPYQFARFRRGDSTEIAGAYRLVRELEMGRPPYNAAFVLDALDDKPPIVVKKDNASANAALLARIGMTPMVASLEVLAPNGKRAARARQAVEPLPKTRMVSDILLLTKGDPSPQPSLESAAAIAFGGPEIDAGTTIGLYWENYLTVSPSTPGTTLIRATRVGASFMQRLGSTFGLSKAVQPVSQRIQDPGRPDGQPGRSIALSWPSVPEGEYLLTLIVQNASGSDSTSTLVKVRNRN